MKKRLVALALAALMALSLLAGCGGQDKDSSGAKPGDSANQGGDTQQSNPSQGGDTLKETGNISYPVDAGGKKLTVWCPLNPEASRHMASFNDHEVFQEVAKRTGIEVEFIHPANGQEAEQLNLLIAGGELPDILLIRRLYSGGAPAGVDEGYFLDLTDMMAEYAPDYYRAVTKDAESYRLATTNDNKFTNFQILKQSAPQFIRFNFMDTVVEKYGMDEMPETIADYDALFAKMAADGLPAFAPVQNGRVDQLMWPYGIDTEYFLDTQGNVQFGPYTEAYKEYLTMMHDWYEKGYIHKDFNATLSAGERMNMFINGEVGLYITSCDNAFSNARAIGHTISVANYPRLNKGDVMPFENVYRDTVPLNNEPQTMVISKDCEDVELAMAWINYFYTEEGATLCNWGIEGKTYTVDANGNKQYTDYMLKNPDVPLADTNAALKVHLWPKLAEPDVICNQQTISNPDALAIRSMYYDDATVNNSQHLPNFIMNTEASTARAKLQNDISTYVDEMTIKFITGATPLSEFDTYMETLRSLKIEEALQITNDEYQIYLSKQVPVA